MSELSTEQRMKVLEMVSRIAAGAAGNTNVVWMIEFQEELIERLYRKMSNLLLEDQDEHESEDDHKYSYHYED